AGDVQVRSRSTWISSGWHAVTMDGVQCEAKFVKVAVNVVRRPGTSEHAVPLILQRWFGPEAARAAAVSCVLRPGVCSPGASDRNRGRRFSGSAQSSPV